MKNRELFTRPDAGCALLTEVIYLSVSTIIIHPSILLHCSVHIRVAGVSLSFIIIIVIIVVMLLLRVFVHIDISLSTTCGATNSQNSELTLLLKCYLDKIQLLRKFDIWTVSFTFKIRGVVCVFCATLRDRICLQTLLSMLASMLMPSLSLCHDPDVALVEIVPLSGLLWLLSIFRMLLSAKALCEPDDTKRCARRSMQLGTLPLCNALVTRRTRWNVSHFLGI